MKYHCRIQINKPIDEVVELFDSEENLFKWQKGLQSIDHFEGEKGKAGAKSIIRFKSGKREMTMTETILRNDLPDAFDATYEAKGALNTMQNRFSKVDETTTIWDADQEFKFSGFMKVIGFLMGTRTFKKQSMKYMVAFKDFVENGMDVRNS